MERLAEQLETLNLTLRPKGSDLYREFFLVCMDEELAVEEALAAIERAREAWRSRFPARAWRAEETGVRKAAA